MRATPILSAPIVAFLLSSCASFQQVGVSPVEGWPPIGGGEKSVNITTSYEYLLNDSALESAGRVVDQQSERVATIYVDSGMFSQVGRGREPADLHATVRIRQNERASIAMAVLTGLTLYLIPSKSDVIFDVTTTFANSDGDELGTIKESETVSTWQQLLLVFVMPFKHPISVNLRTMNDLHRATLMQAKARGII